MAKVVRAEEKAYMFVAEDPGVATMSNKGMFSVYFIISFLVN